MWKIAYKMFRLVRPVNVVYLAGGINGCTDSECKCWRERAKKLLKTVVRDPMERDYRGVEKSCYDEIVRDDLADIDDSNVLLVNASKASWGTAMEIRYAFSLGKDIYAFGAGDNPSPWLLYHCNLFSDLETACKAINEDYE